MIIPKLSINILYMNLYPFSPVENQLRHDYFDYYGKYNHGGFQPIPWTLGLGITPQKFICFAVELGTNQ